MQARTWLLVAAEQREFDGILKRFGGSKPWNWPARFAAQAEFDGDRWLLIANGPGAALVDQALSHSAGEHGIQVNGIISTGFCGALDPALRVGDIVRELHSIDRVAVTAAEKHDLWVRTGAAAVDMESAAAAAKRMCSISTNVFATGLGGGLGAGGVTGGARVKPIPGKNGN